MGNQYPSFQAFPRTEPPPSFAGKLAAIFSAHRESIDTVALTKGLESDEVLARLRTDLTAIGFEVEEGKRKTQRIERPVFFGSQGKPTLQYQIDAYHSGWLCGLEIEAGRALMGNAVYRDIVQALVMVKVDVLVLAVPLSYKHKSNNRDVVSPDFDKTCAIAEALYGHSRFQLPYRLLVIGY